MEVLTIVDDTTHSYTEKNLKYTGSLIKVIINMIYIIYNYTKPEPIVIFD